LVIVLSTTACTQAPSPTSVPTTAGTPTPAPLSEVSVAIGWEAIQGINDDELGKYIQSMFAMKIEPIEVGENIIAMALAGDLPDVFGGTLGDPNYYSFINEGYVRDIPQAMIDKYPTLKAYIESCPATMSFKQADGKLYSIPRRTDYGIPLAAAEFGIYYRADWATKLGIAEPTTMDELKVMMKAFTEQDPDGNGVKDTYGTSGWLWQIHYAPWNDMYNWVKEDGKWIPGYAANAMVPALQFWNGLYKEGILDPEFAEADDMGLFLGGKIGVLYAKTNFFSLRKNYEKNFPVLFEEGTDIMQSVKIMPALKKDSASAAAWPSVVQSQCSLFSKNCTDEELDRLLAFYDWSLSAGGRDLRAYGLLDVDYMTDKEGKAVNLLPTADGTTAGAQIKIYDKYPSIQIFNLISWSAPAETPARIPDIAAKYTDLWTDIQTRTYGPFAIPVNLAINSIITPAKSEYAITTDDAEFKFLEIIAGEDATADFAAYRTELLTTNGLQKVIDEVNAEVVAKGLG
jgi:putative aldouronate transport system substrate-binding protein